MLQASDQAGGGGRGGGLLVHQKQPQALMQRQERYRSPDAADTAAQTAGSRAANSSDIFRWPGESNATTTPDRGQPRRSSHLAAVPPVIAGTGRERGSRARSAPSGVRAACGMWFAVASEMSGHLHSSMSVLSYIYFIVQKSDSSGVTPDEL